MTQLWSDTGVIRTASDQWMPGIVWSATAAEVKQSCRRNTAHMLELTFPTGTVLQRYYDEYAAAANNNGNSTLETEVSTGGFEPLYTN